MIKKFQLGGQQLQLLDQIFAMINLQPEEALKQLAQSGAKPEDIAKIVQVGVQLGKINPEVGKAVMQALQGQVSAAKHGMKLQYIKSLKHKCAEDEELYYYKKGGSIGCGCKKKENGGEVVKAQDGTVTKFKNDLKNKLQQQLQQKPKWTDVEDNELKKLSEKKNPTPQEKQRLQQLRNKFKNSSNTSDYELEEGKKGMKVEKDCGGSFIVKKFKAARCGSKMKKHELGGSLNGIPFYLKGTPKGGIEFQENLEPPTYGVFGELGRNLEQGSELFGKIIGSPATLILLTGLGSGVAGMVGPTVRILKDAKTALGSKSGFRNAIRKISRNLNAKKGSPEFKWIKTSGDIKKGGFTDRAFNGMGNSAQRTVSRATRSEGSGYNAQQMLNNNPIYLLARSNPESLGWKPYHTPANNLAYTTSNRVFERNRLIDKARDWRNWIFK